MGEHNCQPACFPPNPNGKFRNKNIATAFFKAGYVEAWGRGYKKIREALESAKLPFPKVENFCGGTLLPSNVLSAILTKTNKRLKNPIKMS